MGNIRQSAYKLTNLLKIFVDTEDKAVRLVFKEEDHPTRRVNKNYQTEDIFSLVEKIILECNVMGL